MHGMREVYLNTRWIHLKHARKRHGLLRCQRVEWFTVALDLYDSWVDTATRAGRRIKAFQVHDGYYLIGL